MKRIEELLKMGNNHDRFLQISKSIKKNQLIIFFGAGLSLWKKYRSWGFPFEWSQKRIKRDIKKLKEYYSKHGGEDCVSEQLLSVESLIKKGSTQGDNKEYLEWGDTLNEAFKKVAGLYNCTLLRNTQFFPSFNEACIASFKSQGKPPEYDMPYQIPPIYYLPYLSHHLITTNVDSSFETICKQTGNDSWFSQPVLPRTAVDIDRWNSPTYAIHYIHGHINEPKSLVMTKSEYKEMYPDQVDSLAKYKGSRMILNNMIERYSVLFLGSSLQKDKTVEIINHESNQRLVKENRKRNKLHFYPVVGFEAGLLDTPPQINKYDELIFDKGKFEEIPVMLLHLVRETTQLTKCCSWQDQSVPVSSDLIPSTTINTINASLADKSTFDIIKIDESDRQFINDLIQFLFKHHSIAQHDSGLGWSICTVNHRDFSLNGYRTEKREPLSPLHNYPIGDTIYVLAGNRDLNAEEAKEIADNIHEWHDLQSNRKKSAKEEVFLPRIRIIMIPPDGEKTQSPFLFDKALDAAFIDFARTLEKEESTLSEEQRLHLNELLSRVLKPTLHDLFASVPAQMDNVKTSSDESENDKSEERFKTRTLRISSRE